MDRPAFRDRRHAGRALARVLGAYANRPDVTVLALPHGGIVVAFEVADALRVPLDVFIVRRLAAPGPGDYTLGAVTSGGVRVLNDNVVRLLGIDPDAVDDISRHALQDVQRLERFYRGELPPLQLQRRNVVLVDDGLAPAAALLTAVKALQARAPQRIVVALPAASLETCEQLRREADALVCATPPLALRGPGLVYEDDTPASEEQARELLSQAWHDTAGRSALQRRPRPAGVP